MADLIDYTDPDTGAVSPMIVTDRNTEDGTITGTVFHTDGTTTVRHFTPEPEPEPEPVAAPSAPEPVAAPAGEPAPPVHTDTENVL